MAKPTFAALDQVLRGLGFTSRVVPGSHVLFELPQPGSRIALRLYQPNEPVDGANLAYVRSTLDDWGLLSGEEFDQRLLELSAAG